MATKSKGSGRRLLRDTISKTILPELQRRCFTCFLESKGGPPSWFFCRKRAIGGFDIISIKLHDGHQALFDAFICVLPAEKSDKSWGEKILVDNTTVIEFPDQVTIASRVVKNRVLRALARSLGVGWFGFKPQDDVAHNKNAAEAACAEFIMCLDQAEGWLRDGSLGPNLVVSRSAGVAR